MKKILAIFAFIGILLQTFNQVVIVAEYYANKDFIAKNLCENRDKPKMHCDGKCCLKKKLQKHGSEQAPSPRSQKNDQVIVLFCAATRFDVGHFLALPAPQQHFAYNDLNTISFHHSVFRPPSVS